MFYSFTKTRQQNDILCCFWIYLRYARVQSNNLRFIRAVKHLTRSSSCEIGAKMTNKRTALPTLDHARAGYRGTWNCIIIWRK